MKYYLNFGHCEKRLDRGERDGREKNGKRIGKTEFTPEERPQLHYNLRNQPDINKTLIGKTVDLNDRDFFVRICIKSAIELTATFT